MYKINPLADRVLVAPDKADKTETGLVLPSQLREKPLRGVVIAIGPGGGDTPMSLEVGDRVLYSKHAGFSVSDGEKNYLLMRECDCLAIFTEIVTQNQKS